MGRQGEVSEGHKPAAAARFSELDAIRGIAALMVVLYHYTVRYGQLFEPTIAPLFQFSIGEYGVQLFFMVSGFVIFLTLDRTRHGVDFIVSRCSRLYPTYWVAVILTFMTTTLFLPERAVDVQSAIINLTMLQQLVNVKSVDGVYWTLAVELAFYGIMYLLFITKLTRKIEQVLLVWLLLIVLAELLNRFGLLEVPWIVAHMLLLEHGPLFIAGILFYRIKQQSSVNTLLLLVMAFATEMLLHSERLWMIALFFMLFYLFASGRLTLLVNRPLIFLGNISYSLYLIHQNLGYVVIRYLETTAWAGSFLILVIPLALSIAIAALLFWMVEQPTLRIVRLCWRESSLRKRLVG